jgi:tRNA threonylcarbamoyladenosine biosynthesis protein TsaE
MVASETVVFDFGSLAQTEGFGHRLGPALFPGAVVALMGPLGAGKTQLVRAVAEGLEIIDGRVVTSPTFVLIQEYDARLPIYHFDAYRLAGPGEFFDLGIEEYFNSHGVSLIEWADRVEDCLPPEHLRLTLAITGETSRRLSAEGRGERYAEVVRKLVGSG